LKTESVRADSLPVSLFLGEWFDGYHEFHLSKNQSGAEKTIVIWDSLNGIDELPRDRVTHLYRQAAMILTCYFNLDSFEQIVSWSHAAGDFILSNQKKTLDVKLITVRKYAPMVESQAVDPKSMVDAVLLFLLNLSIRMRLDRLDGIGDLVWADERAVAGTVKGFFNGLAQKASIDPIAAPFCVFFRAYLLGCTADDLYEIAVAMVSMYHPEAPETVLVRNHLKQHISSLYEAIRSFR
jgi:hypothetical protein